MHHHLRSLAQYGFVTMASALFGTEQWKAQWLHSNLPVMGSGCAQKVQPEALTELQEALLLTLWQPK